MDLTSLAGEEPKLLREIEMYLLEIVRLSSTHSLGSETQLIEKGWSVFYSGVAESERSLTRSFVLTALLITSVLFYMGLEHPCGLKQ